jgi:histidyl-tRNA synthetase
MEQLCALYGYRPIQTPVFEDTELFARTSGAGSDVVQKEMYTFTDRSERSLTLRPDLTAPICRAYVQHGMHREPQPVKLYEIASVYRYAAPQRGRYREHWQLSVEALGSDDPALDAEIMHLYYDLLQRLGVRQWELQLNSIGDRNCRPQYVARLNEWLDAHADVLDEDARQKWATTPLRVFDVKNPQVRAALEEAPKIGDSLCDACREHFAGVRSALDTYGIPYTLEPTLVRGLDYYTRTVWEFVGPEAGAQSAISAGGRYDYLIEEIDGPPTPAVGIGAGIERLVLACETEGIAAEDRKLDVFVAFNRGDAIPIERILELITDLRRAGLSADTDYGRRSLKGQLTQAEKRANAVVIYEGDGQVQVRRRGAPDKTLRVDELVEYLRQ